MSNASEEFKKELLAPTKGTAADNLVQATDITLSLITDGVVDEIPIIKWFKAAFKIAIGYREYNHVKKMLRWVENVSVMDKDEIFDFFQRTGKDEKFKEKMFSTLIHYVDLAEDLGKIDYQAILYKRLVKEELSTIDFFRFSFILSKIYSEDIKLLPRFKNQRVRDSEQTDYALNSFQSVGLLDHVGTDAGGAFGGGGNDYTLNKLGEAFLEAITDI